MDTYFATFSMESSSNWTIFKGTIRIQNSVSVDLGVHVDTFLHTLIENFIQFVNDQAQSKCFVRRHNTNVNELIIMRHPG